jgi:hypothetical protein
MTLGSEAVPRNKKAFQEAANNNLQINLIFINNREMLIIPKLRRFSRTRTTQNNKS